MRRAVNGVLAFGGERLTSSSAWRLTAARLTGAMVLAHTGGIVGDHHRGRQLSSTKRRVICSGRRGLLMQRGNAGNAAALARTLGVTERTV